MTFEEAYRKTGRVFCVTLSATSKKAPPVLINYITAPTVTIASAVLASAAVPGFVDAMRLQVKDENGVVGDQSKCDEVSLFAPMCMHVRMTIYLMENSSQTICSSIKGISRWKH